MKNSNFPAAEFQKVSQGNPYWSSYTCFAEVIRGRTGLSKRIIRKFFHRLVDPEDYAKNERFQILEFLLELAATQEKAGSIKT